MKTAQKRNVMLSVCIGAALLGGYLSSAAQTIDLASQNDSQTKEDKQGAAVEQEDIYVGLTKMEQAQAALSSQKPIYQPSALTTAQPQTAATQAETAQVGTEESSETAKPGSVQNEKGFFVKQDAESGHPEVYNSLTKEGLWVGGTDGQTGFRVTQAGDMITSGAGSFGGQLTVQGGAIINGVTVISAVDGSARTYQSVTANGSKIIHRNNGITSMVDVNDSGGSLTYINWETGSISDFSAEDDAVTLSYVNGLDQVNSLTINKGGTVIDGNTHITSADGRTNLYVNGVGGAITTVNKEDKNKNSGLYVQSATTAIRYEDTTTTDRVSNTAGVNESMAVLDHIVKDKNGQMTVRSRILANSQYAAMQWSDASGIVNWLQADQNGAWMLGGHNYIKVDSSNGTRINGKTAIDGDTDINGVTNINGPTNINRDTHITSTDKKTELYIDYHGAEMHSNGSHGASTMTVNEETGAVTKYEVKDNEGAVVKTNSLTVDRDGIAAVGDTLISSSNTSAKGGTRLEIWSGESEEGDVASGFLVQSGSLVKNPEKPGEAMFTGGVISAQKEQSGLGYVDNTAGIANSIFADAKGASIDFSGKLENGEAARSQVSATADGAILAWADMTKEPVTALNSVTVNGYGTIIKGDLYGANDAFHMDGGSGSLRTYGQITVKDNSNPKDIKTNVTLANGQSDINGVTMKGGNVSGTAGTFTGKGTFGTVNNRVILDSGRITSDKKLTVKSEGAAITGDTTITGKTTITSTNGLVVRSGTTLDAKSVTLADGNVVARGDISGVIGTFTGNMTVKGDTILTGVLTANSGATIRGATVINGGVDITGEMAIKGKTAITGNTIINNGTFTVSQVEESEAKQLFNLDGKGNMMAAGNLSAVGGRLSVTDSEFALDYYDGDTDKTMTVNGSAVRFGVTASNSGMVSIDLTAQGNGKIRSNSGFAVGSAGDTDQTIYGKDKIIYGADRKEINLDSIGSASTTNPDKGGIVQFDKDTTNQINGVTLDNGKVTATNDISLTSNDKKSSLHINDESPSDLDDFGFQVQSGQWIAGNFTGGKLDVGTKMSRLGYKDDDSKIDNSLEINANHVMMNHANSFGNGLIRTLVGVKEDGVTLQWLDSTGEGTVKSSRLKLDGDGATVSGGSISLKADISPTTQAAVRLGTADSVINGTEFVDVAQVQARRVHDYSIMTPTGVAVGASQEYTLYGREAITYKKVGSQDEIKLSDLKGMADQWNTNGQSFQPKTPTANYSLRSLVSNTMVADESTSDDRPTPGQNADTDGSSIQNSAGNGFWAKDDGTNTIKGNTTFDNDLTVTGKTQLNGGLDVGGKAITGVGDGKVEKDSKEAVNGSQLYTEQQARIDQDKVLGTQINDIGRSVNKLGGEIDSVGAISAALAGLHPIDYDPSKSKYQIAAAMGSYDGSTAMALGGFYNVNRDVLVSFGVSSALKGERKTAGNIGATFRIGAGNSKAIGTDFTNANLLTELAAVRQENDAQKQRLALQDEKLAVQDEKLEDQQKQLDELKALLASMQSK